MKKMLEMMPFIDLSMDHITPGDRHLLEEWAQGGDRPCRIIRHDFGFFVNVAGDPEILDEYLREMAERGCSDSFRAIYRQAAAQGAWWINFDEDGTENPALISH